MIRLVATAVISVIANAIALVVANAFLEDMELGVSGFITAVVVFTVAMVLAEPLTRQIALKNAPALIGSTALVATVLALVTTAMFTDSLTVRGLTTWVLATVIVWVIAMAARLLLPTIMFKKALAQRSANQAA